MKVRVLLTQPASNCYHVLKLSEIKLGNRATASKTVPEVAFLKLQNSKLEPFITTYYVLSALISQSAQICLNIDTSD